MSYAFKPRAIFFYSIALVLFSTSAFASVTEIAIKQKDAVVTIFAFGKEKDSLGSGFVISKDGTVATNYHVAKNCISEKATCIVKMENGAFFPVDAVVAVDEENDLALIKMKGKGLPTVRLAREHSGKLGESVVVIGSPKGLETTVSDGIVSAIRDGEVLQITAPISPGSSGSPVFNAKGEVIGVATYTVKEGQNLNFAIPVKFVNGLYREYTASPRTSVKKSAKRVVEPKPKSPKAEAKPESPKVEPPKPEPPLPDPTEVKKARVNDLIQQAKTELSMKLFESARKSCDTVIELDSNIAEAFYLRSEVYLRLESFLLALSDADRAIKIDPRFDKAYVNRGFANASLGNYADAIKDIDQALALNPSSAPAFNVRSMAQNQLGNHIQALSDANHAINIDSTIFGPYFNRGVAHLKLGNLQEALNDHNTALKINPNHALGRSNRCHIYDVLGDYSKALQDCNEAIRLNPRLHTAYCNRGDVHHKLKDYNRANDDTTTSLRLKVSAEAYDVRCLTNIELKKYNEAVSDSTNALELSQKNPNTYYNRGYAYYKMGDKKRAIPDFQIAARMGSKVAQGSLRNLWETW
jgi:tetratricopeptide (TPR) repeat protein/V8-like Glu-specific endopeptidase